MISSTHQLESRRWYLLADQCLYTGNALTFSSFLLINRYLIIMRILQKQWQSQSNIKDIETFEPLDG